MPGARTMCRCDEEGPVQADGAVVEIWLAGAAAEPMRRVPAVEAIAGLGLAGDRYALGGGTWARTRTWRSRSRSSTGARSPPWPPRPGRT